MANRRWIYWLPEPIRTKLSGRVSLQAVVANSGWLMLDKIIRIFMGLLVGAWIARHLGANQFGEIAYALAYIAFFQAITSLGIDGIIVREISYNKTKASEIISTGIILRLGIGLLCWIIAISCIAWLHGWSNQATWIVAIVGSGLVFQAADTFDLWFQSQSQSRYATLAKLSAYAIINIIKIILLLNQAPLLYFVLVMSLEAALNALALALAYRQYPCPYKLKPSIALAVRFIKESWPLILSGVSIIVYTRIDQILIKEILTERDLGIYAAVLPFSTVWQIIPMTLAASVAPYLARQKAENETAYLLTLDSIFRGFALIGWLVCIPICIFSNLIVSLLLGDEYREGGKILSIYVFTNIFIGLGIAQSLWAVNEKKSNIFLYKLIIGAAVCLIGNLFLLPTVGIGASAFVAVASHFFAVVLSNIILAPTIFKMQIRSIFFIKQKI
jgi:O-antigen/teichoic acid export membrane protein